MVASCIGLSGLRPNLREIRAVSSQTSVPGPFQGQENPGFGPVIRAQGKKADHSGGSRDRNLPGEGGFLPGKDKGQDSMFKLGVDRMGIEVRMEMEL